MSFQTKDDSDDGCPHDSPGQRELDKPTCMAALELLDILLVLHHTTTKGTLPSLKK